MAEAEGQEGNGHEEQHEDQQQGEEEEKPVEVKRVLAITGGGLRDPWIPEITLVNGTEYIKLSKWCPSLTKFCTGTSKKMHRSRGGEHKLHTINVMLFQQLTERRRQACNQAVRDLILTNAEADGQEPPQKFRPATQQDEYLVDRTVQVRLEAAGDFPSRQVKVLWQAKG